MTSPFDHERWEELAVAHALDALEPSEDATFVEHLTTCARCSGVVDDVMATATELALSVDQAEPSAGARASLLDQVSSTPQLPQLPVRAPSVPDAAVLTLPGRRKVAPASQAGRWLVAAAAAVALVLGVAAVATFTKGNGAAKPDGTVAQAFGRCLDDKGCTPIRLLGSDGAVLAAVLVRGTQAEVVSERLAPNPAASTTYVLWAQHTQGAVKPVGVFDVTSRAVSVHEMESLPWKLSDISVFMVSREAGNVAPATGSAPVAKGSVSA